MPLQIHSINFDELSADPGSPIEGQVWYNTTSKQLKLYRNGAIDVLVDYATFSAHSGSTANPHSTTLEQARTSGATFGGSVNFGAFALTNVGAGSSGTDGAQRQWVTDQIRAYLAGLEWQEDVINFQNSPPGSPGDGDRYVVTAVATGAWVGKEDQIAEYSTGLPGWVFTVPNEGYALRDDTANTMMLYSGTGWGNFGNAIDHNVLLNLTTGDPHTQYQKESEKDAASGYAGLEADSTIGDTRHGSRSGGSLHSLVSTTGAGFYPKSNRAAVVNPTVSDDNTAGYAIGSRWINTATDEEFVATDVSTGAALWKSTTASAGTALVHKAGQVLAVSFAGNPKKATVTFSTPFSDANYAVALTPVISVSGAHYVPNVESQLAGSFVINMGTNFITSLVSCAWVAIKNGESA